MNRRAKPWPRRAAFWIIAALAAYRFFPLLVEAISGSAPGIVFACVIAFLVTIVVIPVFLLAVWDFAYMFAKPYVRAWHINRIRNARLMRETRMHERDLC